MIAEVESALGPIDIYVANTGGPPAGADPLGFTREQWEAAHRTLVLSPMAFLERLLPGMRERGWGRVVAVGSMAVREPIAALQLSNAHRPGLVAAFKVLAKQAAADGVTLNTVLPGRIATDRCFATAELAARRPRRPRAKRCRPAGSARSRSSPPPRSSSARRRRATSPARRCSSTAASPLDLTAARLDSAAYGPLAQLAEQGTSGRSASRETASSSAAICWNPLRALGTDASVGENPTWIGRSAGNPAVRESPQRPYAAHPNGTAEGEEMVQTASPRRWRGWPVKAGAAG